jgi:hypothetical protein
MLEALKDAFGQADSEKSGTNQVLMDQNPSQDSPSLKESALPSLDRRASLQGDGRRGQESNYLVQTFSACFPMTQHQVFAGLRPSGSHLAQIQ